MALIKFLNFVPTTTFRNRLVKTKKCNINESRVLYSKYKNKNKSTRNFQKFYRNLCAKNAIESSNGQIAQTLLKELDSEMTENNSYLNVLFISNKKLISILVAISSIIGGWFFTPTKKKIFSIIISFIIGSVAFFTIRNLNFKNNIGAQGKILENILINKNNDNIKKEIDDIQREYDISQTEIRTEILNVYKKFIGFYLRENSINFSEIKKLLGLKSLLGLTEQEIGQCHYEFAKDLYKKYIIMLERNESSEITSLINKFFFLSDKILSKDSQKGYQYEFSRIVKIFLFSQTEMKQICDDQSVSLYKENIKTLINSKKYENSRIQEITEALGINENQKNRIDYDFLSAKIQFNIQKENKISQEGKIELENLCSLLDISNEVFLEKLILQTGPLFNKDLTDILLNYESKSHEKETQETIDAIKNKQIEYLIPGDIVTKEFFLACDNANRFLFDKVSNDIKGSKGDDIPTSFDRLFFFKENMIKLYDSINLPEQSKKTAELSAFIDKIGSTYDSKKIIQIYNYFVGFSLKDYYLSETNGKNLENLKQIFSISFQDSENIYNNIAGPMYLKKVQELIVSKRLSSAQKEKIKQLETSMKLTKKLVLNSKISVYQDTLDKIFEKLTILSEKDLEELNKIRQFLNLKWENIQNIHNTKSEPIFYKSVTEAMGATGIIPANYWQGLEKLRKRLQLTEGKAKEIFYKAVREKLKTIFEKAVVENKKKNQPQEVKNENGDDPTIQKGSGTALGIEAGNAEGNELFNLVDLYFRNKIFIDKGTSINETRKNTMNGLPGRTEIQISSKSKPEFIYPVSLNGLFDKKTVNNMYKQYLVECFSAKLQSEKRRLFNNLDKLGPILGLDEKEINSIHLNVGMVIFQKFLSQALSKGYLDKSDTAFLSSIQTTLSMDTNECNNLLKNGKKSTVNLAVEKIFSSPKIDPLSVTKTRNLAYQLKVNLKNDLKISLEQRSKLFRIELDFGIEKGRITNESQNIIGEIQKAYVLDDNITKKILADCITTKSEGHLINAIASLRRNSEDEALTEIKKMLNFGNLLPLTIEASVGSKKEKNELFSLYSNNREDSINSVSKEKTNRLLKLMLNLD
mmetsp:Transcript_19934/g.48314  ORF Transcript_19934/g.48314 Transcript_19934/m.48314 type:complete len:1092 (-) Transcript_19934:1172-4447(-)